MLPAGVNDETAESETTDTAKPPIRRVAATGPKEDPNLARQTTLNPKA